MGKVTAAAPAPEDDGKSRKAQRALLAGVFLISFSLLAFEIALTRVLSVMLSYHYVFVVVSFALLGLGTGGVLVHLFRASRLFGGSPVSSRVLFASLFALTIPVSLWVVTSVPAVPWVVLLVPFVVVGVVFAGVFYSFPGSSSRTYGADLTGAAAGSVGAVLGLNLLGGINTVLALGLVAATGALVFASAARSRLTILLPAVSLLLVSGILAANLAGFRLVEASIDSNSDKEILSALSGPARGEIVDTRWSAFGRTDLVAFRSDPDMMLLFIDGTAGTPVYRFNGDVSSPNPRVRDLKRRFPGYLPLADLKAAERNSALIIGPGGGRDILLALLAGVDRVTAVEVNPDLVELMDRYAWYNGGIYRDFQNVSLVVDEGRSFLKRQKEKYDIIMLSLPITKTSRSVEGYALTENFLFTTDSINDYLEHLTDEGRLIVVAHVSQEVVRLLSLVVTAYAQRGVNEASVMDRVYVVGSEEYPVFVLKKTPFEPGDLEPVHRSIHDLGYAPALSYLPAIRVGSCTPHEKGVRYDECAMLNPLLIAMKSGLVDFASLYGLLKDYNMDITPVSDDKPFFYKLDKGTPMPVLLVLVGSLVLLAAAVFGSLRGSRRRTGPGKYPLRFVVFFAMLGAGFMLVEIPAIQRFSLFLGQPVLSLAALLFSLLVGAGMGSLYSDRLDESKSARVLVIVSLCTAAVLLVYALFLPTILGKMLGFDIGLRLLATLALLAPLGFLMGFPFPLGMRRLKGLGLESTIPSMWAINGISSVLGSSLTLAVAISFGFTWALLLGATCYFAVFLVSRTLPAEGSA